MVEQLRRITGYEENGIFGFPHYDRPEITDSLFTSSRRRRDNVLIGGRDNDWGLYCTGYWRAADSLVDHLTQTRNPGLERPYASYWESQAYAILFLYRHYLELRLKEMYLACGGENKKINRQHRLLNLWELLKSQELSGWEEASHTGNMDDLNTADIIIKEFDKIDRDSQAFRYPINHEEQITITRMQVDLVRLKKILGWLSNLLDGWSLGIYEYTQMPRD